MLSWLSELKDISIFFNLFNYVSFRTGGAVLTAFIMSLYMGPRMIAWLRSLQGAGQPIRDDGPETHLKKSRNPDDGWPDDFDFRDIQHAALGAME